ncbi:hypothetical protein [Halorussus caseinilyticus]|uniref:hypothetical protein n=1 Tax=Halorussus caseinilyticus TaxID=3034025 RepID=UPI0023E89DDE|nr:hypothetical protein [Halorussus sp. DT72]
MRKLVVTLTILAVVAGLAAGATGGPGPRSDSVDGPDPTGETPEAAEPAAREPPDLPEQWRRTYGASGDDIFADVARTDDGGYLLVGWAGGENRDGWVLKTDGAGEKQWSKTLGGPGTDRFWGVVPTDEGYLLAGRTDDGGAKGWLVEVSADGEVRENRTLGTGAFYAVERRASGTADADGGASYLLAGWTRGDGGVEGWAAELSADRSTAWQESFPAPEGYDAGYLRAVVPTDEGYYLAGKVEGDSDDAWALRLAADGTPDWQTTAGGASRDDVWAAAPASVGGDAIADASAGFVLAGETESDSTGPRDGWLVKFGPEGTVEWERRPGGEGTQWLDSAMRTDGGYLFTGGSDAGPNASVDGYLLATDDAGETRRQRYYGTDGWDKPWPAIRAHGPGYLLAGQTSGGGAEGKDGWLVRIGASAGETATAAVSETGTTPNADTATGAETAGTSALPDTTDAPIRGDTATETATSGGPVPGFGVGAALVALAAFAAALLALRR